MKLARKQSCTTIAHCGRQCHPSTATGIHCERIGLVVKGTKSGSLYVNECPSLDSYSWCKAHAHRVECLLNIKHGGLSVSCDTVRLHAQGCRSWLTYRDKQVLAALLTAACTLVASVHSCCPKSSRRFVGVCHCCLS